MIYQFTYPDYETDSAEDRENPVILHDENHIPSINCEDCGTWTASTARIWCATTDTQRQPFAEIQFLPRLQWQQEAPAWAELLGVPLGTIAPGAAIGVPPACHHHDTPNDFLHTDLGPTLATESARVGLSRRLST